MDNSACRCPFRFYVEQRRHPPRFRWGGAVCPSSSSSYSSPSLHTMTSSHVTDTSAQTSQLRPATSGPTQVYQDPTSTPSNLTQSSTPPSQLQGASRPHSVAELEERARQSCVDIRPFKAWLRIAENARRDAKDFHEQGDLESAFVEFEKAATVMLEKIPAHPDFRVFLSAKQRIDVSMVSSFYPLGSHSCACGSISHLHISCKCKCISVLFMVSI
jgi:USP8 dimerisation domain